jgi:hypothetical protein
MAVVLGSAISAAHWIVGALPLGRLDPLHVAVGSGVAAGLVLTRYLKREAAEAIDSFRPALAVSPQMVRALRYRLTILPARPAVVWSLATLVGFPVFAFGIQAMFDRGLTAPPPEYSFLSSPFRSMHVALLPLTVITGVLLIFALWVVLGTLLFQIVRQLQTIEEIYTRHTKVNLFHGTPLHAFSGHTARVGITLILLGNTTFLVGPELLQQAPTVAAVAALSLLGVAAFLLPLLGIHGLLVKEKDRLLTENALHTQAMVGRLHASLRKTSLRGLNEIEKGLSSLEREHTVLSRIPTWPWQPGTLRGIIAAVLLPVFIWAIQFFLGRMLG